MYQNDMWNFREQVKKVFWPFLSSKQFLGGFWHLSQLKFEEISPKIPRMQILRKLAPLLVPFTVPPVLSPLGVNNFFGKFLASISAQVWRNITKNTKNVDVLKTGPPAGPVYCLPCLPWGTKNFWEVSGIYLSSSLKKYHQKYQECRF